MKNKQLNIALFGAPGTGKGTQSKRLIPLYNAIHIAPGDIFRQEMANNTPLGQQIKTFIEQGSLAPEHIVVQMVSKKLNQHQASPTILFDGYPRSLKQAHALDEQLGQLNRKLDLVFLIEVKEAIIQKRLAHRQQKEGRADDQIEKIRHRLQLYQRYSPPIIQYYQAQNKLITIDGLGTVNDTFSLITQAIQQYQATPTD